MLNLLNIYNLKCKNITTSQWHSQEDQCKVPEETKTGKREFHGISRLGVALNDLKCAVHGNSRFPFFVTNPSIREQHMKFVEKS